MKVLVYFSSVKHKANFEGDRLRKTIVGALNRLEVEYTLDTSDDYDIVHLISPLDISIAENAKLKGIPVVFSALYTEGDPQARYIDKSTGIPHLIPSALKALDYASLIFVPSEGAKAFLKDEGACRVHGGGFAGTIQALIPINRAEEYKKYMNSIFGEGSAAKIRVRQSPVCEI